MKNLKSCALTVVVALLVSAAAYGDDAVMVKDIYPGWSGSNPYYLTVFNGKLYFHADNGTNGEELWKSDGTAAGTVMVTDINTAGNSFPYYLTVFNGKLYFQADNGTNGVELWESNGTAAGTVMVTDINPGGGELRTAVSDGIQQQALFSGI